MFSKVVTVPIIFEVSKNAFLKLSNILEKSNLYFSSKILFSSKFLIETYREYIPFDLFSDIILVEGGNIEEITALKYSVEYSNSLLVAFGGGSIIDLAKVYAKEYKIQYLNIPSSLSNDAIYSPIARLKKNGIKYSYPAYEPLGIIADISVIEKSPREMLLSGVGDLVSNLSAIKDWMLAMREKGERVDNFSIALASLSAYAVLNFGKNQLYEYEFLQILAYGLVLSGLSMIVVNSSRPCSGAEHLISHAIDELYPEKSTLHGIQVAWAMLYIEKNIRNDYNSYRKLYDYFEKIGLLPEIENRISFSSEEIDLILSKAKKIRNRYTILNIK